MKFEIEQVIEVLSRTPAVLDAMLSGLSEPWVRNNYGAKTFSPFDVVGHLIHGERTDWIPRAKIILQHGETKTFEPYDRYAMFEHSKGKTLDHLLETFEVLRKANLETLRAMNLTPEKLALRGTHPELGAVTMQQLLATWVVHDLNHFHQIAKCMAWQYKDSVGPWLPYVGVLKPGLA
ncbi:MAG: DinB family protein [Planctomycetes bacterium]|nr:DinB family protein [Planctomycetota bacterium]